MTRKAYEQIAEGLYEALAIARGKKRSAKWRKRGIATVLKALDADTKAREPSDPIERLYGLVEELDDIIANLEDAEKLRDP